MAMKSSDKRATAELMAALVEIAIAHGRRHYSESDEPLATTLAVLECLQREGFVIVEDSSHPLKLARLALERVPSVPFLAPQRRTQHSGLGGSEPLAPGPLAFPADPRVCCMHVATTKLHTL